jgi:hypothetical protein
MSVGAFGGRNQLNLIQTSQFPYRFVFALSAWKGMSMVALSSGSGDCNLQRSAKIAACMSFFDVA